MLAVALRIFARRGHDEGLAVMSLFGIAARGSFLGHPHGLHFSRVEAFFLSDLVLVKVPGRW